LPALRESRGLATVIFWVLVVLSIAFVARLAWKGRL
jgi:hypothetical protein